MRKERLELSRLTALEPKSSASTNSATLARYFRAVYFEATIQHGRFKIKRALYLNFIYFVHALSMLKNTIDIGLIAALAEPVIIVREC